MVLSVNSLFSLNSIKQLIFVIVKCCVLFTVRAEFLSIIWKTFGFKGLKYNMCFFA
jgi:hypothetical protein